MAVDSASVALMNIGERGVEQRLVRAVTAFAVTLAAVVAMRAIRAPAWAFLGLAVPFWGAFMLAYQGLYRT